jgi:geranylgeranyl diphosphate synthase, type I
MGRRLPARAVPCTVSRMTVELSQLRAGIEVELATFLAKQHKLMADINPESVVLIDSISEFISGGKRLRPTFLLAGWLATSSPLTANVFQAAAALELLQACALIHDDVMDSSDTRRGKPATHREFATYHRGHRWLGSSETFGTGAAILLGDLCLSWADELLMSTDFTPEQKNAGKQIYDLMRTELMIGQYLDLLEQARGGGSIERAFDVIRLKSAKYTIEKPLVLGATLAGANPELIAAVAEYGLTLGEAFQLRDDVLGVYGDPQETGKPAGDDLREGKQTVLIAEALATATPQQHEAINYHLGNPAIDDGEIAMLREIITATGALQRVEHRITDMTNRAKIAAKSGQIPIDVQSLLLQLADAATSRKV